MIEIEQIIHLVQCFKSKKDNNKKLHQILIMYYILNDAIKRMKVHV